MRIFASIVTLLALSHNAEAIKILRSVIRGTDGNDGIFGLVAVTETDDGAVTLEAQVSGLPDGDHDFRVHKYGDIVGDTDGSAAGGTAIGIGPDDSIRHVGDLGFLTSANGMATYRRTFAATDESRPTIVSDLINSIIGRSFVINTGTDDLTTAQKSSARLAVGVIGIGNHELYEKDTAAEFTKHMESKDFEDPDALVCLIVGDDDDDITGYGSVTVLDGETRFAAVLSGLEPDLFYTYRVHLYGEEYDFSKGVTDAVRDLDRTGGRFNVMGVIDASADGTGATMVTLPKITNLRQLVGRSCLVHAVPDDESDDEVRIASGQLGYANPATFGSDMSSVEVARDLQLVVDDESPSAMPSSMPSAEPSMMPSAAPVVVTPTFDKGELEELTSGAVTKTHFLSIALVGFSMLAVLLF